VTLFLSASDGGSGVYQMRFSNDGSSWSSWEAYGVSKTWTLSSEDGTKTIYVQYKDNVGNVSGNVTDTIILDTVAPFTVYVSKDDFCNGNNPCYPNIQNGIAVASGPSIIQIALGIYSENIILDFDEEITLEGGWDTNFTSDSSNTTIAGSLTIKHGMMIIENIILK
jgi:hypothetical protein